MFVKGGFYAQARPMFNKGVFLTLNVKKFLFTVYMVI